MKIISKLRQLLFSNVKMKYRSKLTTIILIFTLIPVLLLGSIYIANVWNTKVESIKNLNKEEIKSSIVNVNNVVIETNLKIMFVSENPYLFYLLNTEYRDIDNIDIVMSQYQIVRGILQSYVQANGNDKNSINVYCYNKSVFEAEYSQNIDYLNANIRALVEKSGNGKIVQLVQLQKDSSNKDAYYMCFYKLISSLDSKLGIVELRVSFNKIKDSFSNQIPENSFIVYQSYVNDELINIKSNGIEAAKTLAYARDYLNHKNTDKYFIIESPNGNDKVMMFIPHSYLYNELKSTIIFSVLIMLFSIIAIILAVKVASIKITNRLERLINLTNKEVEKLIINDDITLLEGNDEFSQIDKSFCDLLSKVKEYYKKVTEYEISNKDLELMLLQERINPHLLYNTLSAIKWAYPDKRLSILIDALVKYYRISLNRGNDILNVRQEIDMIEQYIKIQQFVYMFSFEYELDIAEEIKDYHILKHTLQPFVENSILHGLNALTRKGYLGVKVIENNNKMVFTISDNGHGIPAEKLNDILQLNSHEYNAGYGIRNVITRLKNRFGDECDISIESEIDKGTTVVIVMPMV